MGSTITKITTKCECGYNWGSCEYNNAFVFKYNRTCDISDIYRIHHFDSDSPSVDKITGMEDNDLSALVDILSNSNEDRHCDDSLLDIIKQDEDSVVYNVWLKVTDGNLTSYPKDNSEIIFTTTGFTNNTMLIGRFVAIDQFDRPNMFIGSSGEHFIAKNVSHYMNKPLMP